MRDMWVHTRDKALSETTSTPFASQQEVTGNAPANTAGNQMLSGAAAATKEGTQTAYDGSRKVTRFAGQKIKERREAARIKNQSSVAEQPATGSARKGTSTGSAGKKTIKGRKSTTELKSNAAKSIKQGGKGVKGAQQAAANTQKAAKAAQQIKVTVRSDNIPFSYRFTPLFKNFNMDSHFNCSHFAGTFEQMPAGRKPAPFWEIDGPRCCAFL